METEYFPTMTLRKLKYWHPTNSIILFICLQLAVGKSDVTENTWKTNCFGDSETGQCKDSLIQICSDYYMCDMVIETNVPPKRIGYVNGKVLVAIESETFFVSNSTLNPVSAKRIISPWDEFVDKLDNTYYAADGTTYMSESESKKEIEIVTTGEHSFNQLAFDFENSKLFILAFHSHNERFGNVFAIKTESLNIVDDKVQAEMIQEIGDQISAMALEGGSDKLLLGIRTTKGGKLVRITKQKGNPCTENVYGKKAVEDIIQETQDKLLKLLANTITISPKNNNLLNSDIDLKSLEMDNVRLKRDLQVATAKLDSISSKLFGFNKNLKSTHLTLETETLLGNENSSQPDIIDFNNPTILPSFSSPLPPTTYRPQQSTDSIISPRRSIPTRPSKKSLAEIDKCIPIGVFNAVNLKLLAEHHKNEELETKLAELTYGFDLILAEVNELKTK